MQNIKNYLKFTDKIETTPLSSVYYLELIDSVDTLLHISLELKEMLKAECQKEYVILVGDTKTYQHLTKLKRTALKSDLCTLVIGTC